MARTALQPPVEVNGEPISAQVIASEAQNHPAPPGKPGYAWRAAARALAVRALLLQEARRLGLEAEPQEIEPGRRETEEEALIRALIETDVRASPPDEAACRAVYDADPERFRAPNLYEAAHILLPAAPQDEEGRANAAALAAAFIAEIEKDPRAFDRLAKEHSACESRASGGRLGQIAAGDTVPEFEAALETLAEGALAPEPVRTRYGVHVMRLDALARGEILPFEAVRPRIRDMLERAAWARAAKDLVARLVNKAEISGVDFPTAAGAAEPGFTPSG